MPAEESALEAFCARWEISRRTLDRAQALAAMGLAPAVTAEERQPQCGGTFSVALWRSRCPGQVGRSEGDVPAAALLDRRSEKLEVPREGPAPEDLENPDETVFREVAGTEDLEALTDRLQAAEGR